MNKNRKLIHALMVLCAIGAIGIIGLEAREAGLSPSSELVILRRLLIPPALHGTQAHVEIDAQTFQSDVLVARSVFRYVLMAKNDSIYVARVDTGRIQAIEQVVFE